MGRTQQSSIKALLESIEQAKQKKEFNILKDLKTLHAQYTKVNKRDYLCLLYTSASASAGQKKSVCMRVCPAGSVRYTQWRIHDDIKRLY